MGEIIFVDDGSDDQTTDIVAEFPVSCLPSSDRGPAAARNTGWQAARFELVWFVDSDCVAHADALARLLPHMDDPKAGGVSGSYGIMNPDSLLACLIHEEIIERHLQMPLKVDFLATFNVLYRRDVLELVGGLDERYLKGQDAELSFRVTEQGYDLRFEIQSLVKHFHATHWLRYFRTQRHQGYWRVFLHMNHRGHSSGDSYSSLIDHIQPPLAMLSLGSLALLAWPSWRWTAMVPFALLMLAQLPMTGRLLSRLRQSKYAMFAPMSVLRSYWRGLGMSLGVLKYTAERLSGADDLNKGGDPAGQDQ